VRFIARHVAASRFGCALSRTKFFDEMKIAFEDYFQKLGDPDAKWDLLRNNFKKKFLVSYGIEIGNEP